MKSLKLTVIALMMSLIFVSCKKENSEQCNNALDKEIEAHQKYNDALIDYIDEPTDINKTKLGNYENEYLDASKEKEIECN